MKKIIALVLAVVMTMGLASVAFAANATKLLVQASSIVYASTGLETGSTLADPLSLAPNATYYIQLFANDGTNTEALDALNLVTVPETLIKKTKVFADWSVGSIDGFSIQLKKIDTNSDDVADRYVNVLVFKTAEKSATTAYDVAGSIKLAESASKAKAEPAVQFGASIGYGIDASQSGSYSAPKTGNTVINFNDADELVDIDFGGLALFEANVAGQGNLNLAWNTTFNSEFAAKYDYANLDFITWAKAPVFNRTGDLYIYAEEDTFIYEVTADGAKEIKKAEYDDAYGAWKIRTRKLGSYVLSDVELKAAEVEAPVVETAKPNPNTGR